MLFLPVSRRWSIEPVVEAFNKSDIPRDVVILGDCATEIAEAWGHRFNELGWEVFCVSNNHPEPPDGRVERRRRHYEMRVWSQHVLRGLGLEGKRILFSEDDTLVPEDVWSRLNAALDLGYLAASGIQRDRHGSGLLGVWDYDEETECFDPHQLNSTSPITEADAVGHYCLLTSGWAYCNARFENLDTSLDRFHTHQLAPIVVDSRVWCGHLTEDGTVL